jgi:hypothetical protein
MPCRTGGLRRSWRRINAGDAFAPSMRQKIDIADCTPRHCGHARDVDGVPPLPVPTECPVTLDELLAD